VIGLCAVAKGTRAGFPTLLMESKGNMFVFEEVVEHRCERDADLGRKVNFRRSVIEIGILKFYNL
jgi:hypothetical protein